MTNPQNAPIATELTKNWPSRCEAESDSCAVSLESKWPIPKLQRIQTPRKVAKNGSTYTRPFYSISDRESSHSKAESDCAPTGVHGGHGIHVGHADWPRYSIKYMTSPT